MKSSYIFCKLTSRIEVMIHKVVTVITTQPVLGTHPDKALTVLQERINRGIGKPLLYGQFFIIYSGRLYAQSAIRQEDG